MIRPATELDIPAIQSIAVNTWPTAYGAIIAKEQIDYMLELMYSTQSLTQQMSKGHQFYMAEIAQIAIGFASVSKEENGVFKLNKLYVLPTTQKTGAGKALLQATINHTKQFGGTQLILQVNKLNNAKDFYLKNGFTILREEVFELEHGYIMDDYIMGINI